MAHIQYTETQRFSQLRWLWMIAIVIILSPLLLLLNDQAFEKDTLLLLLTILATWIPIGVLMLLGKFELELNETGLRYRFLPKIFKWKFIAKENIESVEVQEPKGLLERFACGYKRRLFRKSIFMSIAGNKFVVLRLTGWPSFKNGFDEC